MSLLKLNSIWVYSFSSFCCFIAFPGSITRDARDNKYFRPFCHPLSGQILDMEAGYPVNKRPFIWSNILLVLFKVQARNFLLNLVMENVFLKNYCLNVKNKK